MKIVISRCRYCGIQYHYQASGFGAGEFNHAEYCPECWEAATKAMRRIPVKREKVWVKTTEITLAELKEIEKVRDSVPWAVHRVMPGMGREKPDGSLELETVRHVAHDGKEYIYSYWGDDDSKAEISVLKEKDTVTGKILGWWNKLTRCV